MVVRARVRGIYSTALSKLLNDHGVELVDVTEPVAERLGIDPRRGEPADVTVKSDKDEPTQILILGFPKEVEFISSILEEKIPEVITFKPPIGLYSSFRTRILGKFDKECVVESPVGKAVLVDEPDCTPDRELPVTVVKVPIKLSDGIVVSSRIRVVGKYAIVGRGARVSFSSFIRSKERIAELLKASTKYVREGFSIRWRSNSDEAKIPSILEEIPHLIKKLKEVEEKLRNSELLEIVYTGEHMNIIELTYASKIYLDTVRREVFPTAPFHHLLRSSEQRTDDIVDLIDTVSKYVEPERLEEWVREWLIHQVKSRKDMTIKHRRLLKRNIVLGRGQIMQVEGLKPLKITLVRRVASEGTYDGLRTPKDPGDYIETLIAENSWHIIHKYFGAGGQPKGVYININTPPEMLPSGQVRYVDLEVDIVRGPEGGCRIIDSEGFRKSVSEGIIPGDVIEKVFAEIEKVLSKECSAAEKA